VVSLALLLTFLTAGTSGASSQTIKEPKYGLTFTLPNRWERIPLTGSDVSGLLDLLTKSDPSMKGTLTTQVKQAAKEGIKIFAVGPITGQFASNMNVIVEPQVTGPSTPGYFDELGVEVKLNLTNAGMKEVKTSKVHWSQGDAVQATYTLHLATLNASVKGIQDYVWHKGRIYVVTFSASTFATDKSVAKIVSNSWHWS